MDATPITGLEELEAHLQQLIETPEMPLDAKLFDEVELQLTEQNIPPLIPRLLPPLTQILVTFAQDPAILVSLSIKLLRPVSFRQAMTLASEESLIEALRSSAPSANILAMTIIHKAAKSPSDTAILSIMKGLVENFLRTWLSTPHVEVGEKATNILGDLLEVDFDRFAVAEIESWMSGMEIDSRKPAGQGLLWRRLFQDREIYGLIYNLCSSSTTATDQGQLDSRQKSLAQARLLRILPRMAALNLPILTHSHFPDIEAQHGLHEGENGILTFAALDMVNKEEDMLMHITLLDFFAELLEVMSTTELSKTKMDILATLVQKATASDETLYKSLESIALNPETAPELIDLLVKLNDYQ